MQPLPAAVRRLLAAANYLHLSVLLRDGSPLSVAVWCALDGDHVLISTNERSPQARATLRDPRVALSVVDRDQPYRSATLRGRVVARRPDPDLREMDAIAHKYTSAPFTMRDSRQVTLVIAIDHCRYLDLPLLHRPGVSDAARADE